jgi:hypothetical protein
MSRSTSSRSTSLHFVPLIQRLPAIPGEETSPFDSSSKPRLGNRARGEARPYPIGWAAVYHSGMGHYFFKTTLSHALFSGTRIEGLEPDVWREYRAEAAAAYERPFDVAVATAVAGDSLAWVYVSAHLEAVCALMSYAVELDGPITLCAAEPAGDEAHQMEATLDVDLGVLEGTKIDVCGASMADTLLVMARKKESGRASFARHPVIVAADAPGVRVETGQASGSTPAILRQKVIFDGVPVEPSKMIDKHQWSWLRRAWVVGEDIFVFGSALAWLMRLARQTRQTAVLHRLSALVASAGALSDAWLVELSTSTTPDSAVLSGWAGLRAVGEQAIDDFDWSGVDDDIHQIFVRERSLLDRSACAAERILDRIEHEEKLRPRTEVEVWRWNDEKSERGGRATLYSDDWIYWEGWSTRPRGSGGGKRQSVTAFLEDGAPSYIPDEIAEKVRERVGMLE